MPTHEEQLRREQELFEKEEAQKHSQLPQHAQVHEQSERLLAENSASSSRGSLSSLKAEAFFPKLAELPKQKRANESNGRTAVPSSRREKTNRRRTRSKTQRTMTQVDRKTGLRSPEPKHPRT